MKQEDEYLSLYEYLGKAAGTQNGKYVKEYADANGVPFQTKEVSTKTYTGKVMTYPKQFLEFYFRYPCHLKEG